MRSVTAIFAGSLALMAAVSFAQTSPIAPATASPPSTAQQLATPLGDKFFNFYAQNMRASLFSGFLTLGSFLFAANTFMVANLKKELYDHPDYKKRVYSRKEQQPSASFYGQLNRLSGLILRTIVLSLTAAILQLTLGTIVPHWIAALICLLVAFLAMAQLLFVVWQIRCNLKDWFEFMEDEAENEYQDSLSPKA